MLGIASMPFLSFSKALNEYELYDVVIIGAGLSGLNAARLLAKAGKNILVLEAQERVGGRTWSQQIDQNNFMDLGGQWIGDGHEQMYKLVSEAGLRTFPSFNEGKNILRLDGTNDEYKGDTPPLGIFALLATQKALNRIDNATSKISLEKPWLSDNANELDNQSVGSFIDETITNSKARKLIKRLLEGELCKSVEDISMLQALSAARSIGSSFKETGQGAIRDRIRGGAQGVCNFLYSQIKDSVKLNSPVSFVNQMENHILIGNDSFTVKTKKVIITAPLPIVKRIKFTPELPIEKQILINSMEMGTVVKIHVVYATPFWRDNGLSGASVCLDELVELSVDNSVQDSEKGIITSLIHADRAKDLLKLSEQERKEVILKAYANLFGEKALKPILYNDYSFTNNPWIGGAYSGHFKNGDFSKYGEYLAKPSGNIHWAGTETSKLFKGFMEGAVLSGERVAKEILK
ncbi:MAG: FAD-dependent oxidoreductase [Bacteroidia bacterium]|nr:FAD-dependent oxidoreductase [Bacteroidia bacterium]